MLSLVFCLFELDLALCLELLSMVVADVVSLQKFAQTLLDGVKLLASGTTAQPSPTPPSRSLRRRKRRQAMMRSLFCAKSGATSSAQVDLPVSSYVASGCVVAPDATPAPIPSGSVLQTNHDVALIDDELDACL